jgi:hypothetical protein
VGIAAMTDVLRVYQINAVADLEHAIAALASAA